MKCPVCNFETDHFPALARHVQKKHMDSFCPICGAKVKFMVKHARQHNDEKHQLFYRCLWQESRTRHAKKRCQKNNKKSNNDKKPRTMIYLNEIADIMEKCKKEKEVKSCEYCNEVLNCWIVEMLINRLAMKF
jgi:hypothetical protein